MRMGRGRERWKMMERTEKSRRKSLKEIAARELLAFIIEKICGRKIMQKGPYSKFIRTISLEIRIF